MPFAFLFRRALLRDDPLLLSRRETAAEGWTMFLFGRISSPGSAILDTCRELQKPFLPDAQFSCLSAHCPTRFFFGGFSDFSVLILPFSQLL